MKKCPGCKAQIGLQMTVCWECFKYRVDTVPFKYFQGTLEQWVEQIPITKYISLIAAIRAGDEESVAYMKKQAASGEIIRIM